MKNSLVLDGSWLIGTASRQLLGNDQNKKFRFPESFGEHTREKHVNFILELLPRVIDKANGWLDELEEQVNQNLNCRDNSEMEKKKVFPPNSGNFPKILFH